MRVPLFAAGCLIAPYVKGKRRISFFAALLFAAGALVVNAICIRHQWTWFFVRLSDSLFGMGLLILLSVGCDILFNGRKGIPDKILRFFGNHSLELYITHVTIRNLMGMTQFQPFYLKYYLLLIVISIFLSVILQRVQKLVIK